jgi:toxin-antitoxin system PIN domain toxin
MTFFPDVNVWLALIVSEHSSARHARAWEEQAAGDWLVMTRITQMGLLRLLTNATVMGHDVLNGPSAWAIVDAIRERENVRFAAEPEGLETAWRSQPTPAKIGPNYWTDSYLAAFARRTGFTLVTFDRGFSKYRDIPVKILIG